MSGDSFNVHTTAQEVVDTFPQNIKGRYIVVTGPSPGGIGYETARAIATKEPKLLVLAGRDQKKLDQAREDILQETPGANLKTVILDLNSQASVRKAAKEIAALGDLDVLINNAAVMMNPYGTTEDGLESQFGANYVGPWLLTNLLIPSLLKTAHPRVVFVSSIGHRASDIRWDDIGFSNGQKYDKIAAYGQSKTAAILNAVELAQKYGPKLTAIALHPGGINTNLQRHLGPEDMAMMSAFFNDDGTPKVYFKTIPEGASTTLTAAFDPRMEAINGSYLSDCQVPPVQESDGTMDALGVDALAPYAVDKASARRLWDLTNKLTGENF